MYFSRERKSSWLCKRAFWLPSLFFIHWIKPSLSYALKQEKKRSECHRVGHFGRVRCRTRTCALLCMKSRNNWLCMQENTSIHSMRPRAREKRSQAERGRTAVDATTASRCCGSAFAYSLVYTFSISNRGPTQSLGPGAKLRYTSGAPPVSSLRRC